MKESDSKEKKIRVTFLAYRSWAKKVIEEVQKICNIEIIDVIEDEETYNNKVLVYKKGYVDCIVLIGWSWIISDEILKHFLCVGVHPSDLPMYRGGSPIQHQIIQGLERTKISLMSISPKGIDTGDIWAKEEWDMTGDTMDVVLMHLSESTISLLKYFFDHFYVIKPVPQDVKAGSYYKRRKPADSQVTWEQLNQMSLKETYNMIRALTDPYPNVFIEDEYGNRLYFKEVSYSSKSVTQDE